MSTTPAKIVRFHNPGAPDVLKMEDIEVGPPKAGEVQIEHKAIGLNYIEVYWRTGVYPQPLPCCPGTEGAGIVRAVGEGVTDLKVGDRVAYGSGPVGSYCTVRNMPAHPLMKIPDSIDFETAAAMMLKGFTAQYLLRRVYKVQADETILFHAAAGGVGTIATQWAKSLGVRVIGTVSTREKAELAKANGCAEVIVTSEENIVDRVKELTDGKGVPVVYDSVGKATFMDSLNCLKPRGMMISFGNASGKVDPVPLQWLAERG
ncbi:quinone oxidoreductase, partial [uncultured Limnobacter sp.]